MRREFTTKVRLEIIKRQKRVYANGVQWVECEKCHDTVTQFEIDHRDPDAMQIDKSRKLTAADGWLLCIPCHAEKTKKDKADIAKAKRREAAHLGARRPKQPMPKGPKLRGPRRTHEGRTSLPPRKLCEDVT